MNQNGELLVVIPTYNEVDNIARMVDTLLKSPMGCHVLVVDDNSPDGTGRVVEELQPAYPGRLHLLKRPGKEGLGKAYQAGFRWALSRTQYQFVLEMDADFSHSPQDAPRLYACCCDRGADLAIGSRYRGGFRVKNWPLGRILISYCASLYVRVITGMPIRDTTAGFVCYRVSALRRILSFPIEMRGYGFQIEMKYLAHKLGYRIREVEIVFTDRELGVSKMSGGIFSEALLGVIKMRCRVPRLIRRTRKSGRYRYAQ